MNEKCCLCPHYNPKSYECEADPENETCFIDAIEAFINNLMEEE